MNENQNTTLTDNAQRRLTGQQLQQGQVKEFRQKINDIFNKSLGW